MYEKLEMFFITFEPDSFLHWAEYGEVNSITTVLSGM